MGSLLKLREPLVKHFLLMARQEEVVVVCLKVVKLREQPVVEADSEVVRGVSGHRMVVL